MKAKQMQNSGLQKAILIRMIFQKNMAFLIFDIGNGYHQT